MDVLSNIVIDKRSVGWKENGREGHFMVCGRQTSPRPIAEEPRDGIQLRPRLDHLIELFSVVGMLLNWLNW